MFRFIITGTLAVFGLCTVQSQTKDSFAIQLFTEVYASSIPNKPDNKNRPGFHYNYTKANNIGVNLALARVHYSKNRFRTNFGLMAGDYSTSNLADEPQWTRNFYEANAGFKVSNSHEIWVDLGLLPSHIGIESAIGKDNFTATRSIVADNSPYYETGVRFSYLPSEKLYFAILTTTGWQNITVPKEQDGASWGLQVTYKPTSAVTLNHSSSIGNVVSGLKNVTRIYFNHYTGIAVSKRTNLTMGWDFGLQADTISIEKTNMWNGWLVLCRYAIRPEKMFVAFRYERFIDNSNVLFYINRPEYQSFNLHHTSLNIDWMPVKGFLLRAEANYQASPSPVFQKNTQLTTRQFSAFLIVSYNFQYSKNR
jgi:hypothetical protein